MDGHRNLLGLSLYLDPGNTRMSKLSLDIIADLLVLEEEFGEVFPCKPPGIPVINDADSKPFRMTFCPKVNPPLSLGLLL
jgi:hypothetical protein